jgi:type II secretory pathway pseudopilin PulG
VIVALAILGITVVTIFQFFSTGLRGVRKAEKYTQALIIAESLIEEAYSIEDPEDTETELEFDGFTATREIEKILSDEENRYSVYQISVRVSWEPSGSLTLRTTRTISETKK